MFIYNDQLRKKKKTKPLTKLLKYKRKNNTLQLSKGVQQERKVEVYLFLLLNSCKVKKLKILKEGEGISYKNIFRGLSSVGITDIVSKVLCMFNTSNFEGKS